MSIAGLDLGKTKIGVAMIDALRFGAHPLATVSRTGLKADISKLRLIFNTYEVGRIVIGLPLNMDGSEGPAAISARRFGAELQDQLGIPVEYWDERLTSVEARERLIQAGARIKRRKGAVDQMAAVLILEDWASAQRVEAQS